MTRPLLILSAAITALSASCAHQAPGSYSKASHTDKDVQAAAGFAVKTQAKASRAKSLELIKVLKAEQQVVAGMNYKMQLSLKENGKSRTAEAVVWSQPTRKSNPYELTSWNWK